ncbi:hypothetical protein [Sediminivirga luteola]|uniref:Uncharacterized protein n=1 Tax=Sediminivirga luteola TaxID=1774748 RepID=A0A8J2TVN9_9MICO|nr:hypothetical protein [Sediminivirga luteola]GGA05191.1 hypothetical protein GCM10011333_04920 [Sediminivirga luteola]
MEHDGATAHGRLHRTTHTGQHASATDRAGTDALTGAGTDADPGVPARLRDLPGWLFRGQRAVILLLLMTLTADVAFMGLHVWAHYNDDNHMYLVHTDRGHAEFFQYIKFLFLFVLTAYYAVEQRCWQVAMWLFLFVFFLVTDMLRWHEMQGGRIADALGLESAFGLRGQDFGELVYLAVAGLVLGVPLVAGFFWGTRRTKWIYWAFLVPTALLFFAGVVLDQLHMMAITYVPRIRNYMAIAEDGGEMLATSLLIAVALRLTVSGGAPGLPLRRPDGSRAP